MACNREAKHARSEDQEAKVPTSGEERASVCVHPGPSAQAALVVETWSELERVECEVEDLSADHRPDDVLSPETGDVVAEEEYRTGRATESRSARWNER